MKKIFASDLDQTLIYSPKFIAEFTEEQKSEIKLIETKENEPISYISKKTIEKISKFMKSGLFIPTTTRTIEQYRRIEVFQNELKPKYAVTSNGGNILIDGEVNAEWNNKIKEEIRNKCIAGEVILQEFEKIRQEEWCSEHKTADDLFYYFIIDKTKYPNEKMEKFKKWLEENGWQFSIQGRKMYMIPKMLDKWNTVKYIAEIENGDVIYTAGDSKLDWSMLINADKSIAPSHGAELLGMLEKNYGIGKKIIVTEKKGIFASEEIVDFVEV